MSSRSEQQNRPSTLLVIRAPKCAGLMSWVYELAEQGEVDLAISTYREPEIPDEYSELVRFCHHFVGGKWIALFDFFAQNPDLLDHYEYFWFPDDDIETTSLVASDFLAISREQGFALSQPALAPDSYYAHRLTLAIPSFRFRRTNFVELMLPLMRGAFLKRVLPIFSGRHAALGIDFFWHQLADDPTRDVAIVDATPMGHYRPRQTHLKSVMTAQQVNIMIEKQGTFDEFSISWRGATILSAVTRGGKRLERGPLLWWAYLRGLSEIRRRVCRPAWTNMTTIRMFRELLTAKTAQSNFNHAAYERVVEKAAH